jgi:Fungal Zn(2)-Cys(6) binuclear cluster domain.
MEGPSNQRLARNPGQRARRPRAARACDYCRQKKYKCDELYPCSYCKGWSSPCYSELASKEASNRQLTAVQVRGVECVYKGQNMSRLRVAPEYVLGNPEVYNLT